MRAMVLEQAGKPLVLRECHVPEPSGGEVQLKVHTCGVCRTDLHVVDGELPGPKLPLILGHEIVGRVARVGARVTGLSVGDRVGVPWLGWTCGQCSYCRAGSENLCAQARFTGYTIDGGYAEFTVADERFCVPIPERYSDIEAAPLLCAGLIGYRSLVRAGDGKRLGIYGFGAAAHIMAQVALYQGRSVYAFTRPGDHQAQQFARNLGAAWAGGSDQRPPDELDAAVIFAPVGALVPAALAAIRKGGTVVCGGIHMSDVPSFPYELLWGERTVCSVANLTRRDAEEFMKIAPKVPVRTTTQPFPLEQANEALAQLRDGRLEGAAVLAIGGTS
ncbi:MAG: zinc-dependent alcohol dehydrogenase family protein [Acidobacteriia bacterium]|nr:zinc-dependent alcohol dehydrogenase family protein [Terriglobia bacterium]